MLEEAALRATLLRMCSSSEIRDPDINLTALQCIELLVIEEKESDDPSLRGFIGTQGYFAVFRYRRILYSGVEIEVQKDDPLAVSWFLTYY